MSDAAYTLYRTEPGADRSGLVVGFDRHLKESTVVYARCAYCGYTAPLNCSGQFMPHSTMLVSLTNMGPTCPMCGPLPPVFMCPFFHRQFLYVPGISPMPQQGYTYAPVVQAQPGASPATLKSAFGDAVGKIATELGKGAAEAMFGQYR